MIMKPIIYVVLLLTISIHAFDASARPCPNPLDSIDCEGYTQLNKNDDSNPGAQSLTFEKLDSNLRSQSGVGHRPLVILIHGFNGRQEVMKDFENDFFSRGFHTLNLNLIGHGRQPEDLNSVKAKDWLTQINDNIALASQLSSEVYIVSHSFGGALAVLASKNITIKGLLLIDPFLNYTEEVYNESRTICAVARSKVFASVEDYLVFKKKADWLFRWIKPFGFAVEKVELYPESVLKQDLAYSKIGMHPLCEATRILSDLNETEFDKELPVVLVTTSAPQNFIRNANEVLQQLSPNFILHTINTDIHHGALTFRDLNPKYSEIFEQTLKHWKIEE